jgi:hypothetical protein
MKKKKSLPRDTAQRARAVFDLAIGEAEPDPPSQVDPHFKSLSEKGSSKGGTARAESLSPAQRKAIAKKAAKTRWGN